MLREASNDSPKNTLKSADDSKAIYIWKKQAGHTFQLSGKFSHFQTKGYKTYDLKWLPETKLSTTHKSDWQSEFDQLN